jgi:hypothetical protein
MHGLFGFHEKLTGINWKLQNDDKHFMKGHGHEIW